ncbi:uncharacterized protein LOC62_05G007565 [Vanrija pseudolonga]|uniref:Uncharacterized protein n=1 Tax=Vanrija pseudolonga TaxID=143232 RepID=A0AAF1BSX4_9TREE|nr:hypothetical protein LOC62_05G007565 [Vanrija pseudolonga]
MAVFGRKLSADSDAASFGDVQDPHVYTYTDDAGVSRTGAVGPMAHKHHVAAALKSRKAQLEPEYAAAVLRCYIYAKVTKGRGEEAIEGKLDVLEREMAVASQRPHLKAAFTTVRREQGLFVSTPTPASPPLLEPLPSFEPIRASGLIAGLSMPPRSQTVATAAITVTAGTMSSSKSSKHYTPRDSLATSPRFDFSAPAPGFTPLPLLDDDSSDGSPPTEGLTHFFPAPPVDVPSGPAPSRAPVVSPSASALPRVTPPAPHRSRESPRTELREQPQARGPTPARNVTSPAATHPRRPPPPPQSQSQPSAPMQIQYSPEALIRSPSSPNANPKRSPTSPSELAYLASGRPYPAPPKWHQGPPQQPPRPALSPPFVPPARPPPRPRNFGPPPGIASTLARSPPRSTSLPGLAAIEQGQQYFHPAHRPQGSLGGTVPTPYGHQRQNSNSGSQGHQRQLSGQQQGPMVHSHQRQLSGSAPAPYYPQQHPGLTYQQNMAASAPDQRSHSRQASNGGGGGASGLQRGPSLTGPGLQRGPSLTYGPPVNVYADTTAQISSILTGPVGGGSARRPPQPAPAPAPALLPPSPLPSADDGERSSGETAPTSYIATPPNASPDPTVDKYTSPRPAPPSPKAGVRVAPPQTPASSYPTQTRLPPPKLSPRAPAQQVLPQRKSSLRRPAAKPRASPPPTAPPVPKATTATPATPAAAAKATSPPKRDFFRKNSASSPQQQQHALYIPHSQRARQDAPAYPGIAGMEARLALVGMSTEPEAKPARRWGNKI